MHRLPEIVAALITPPAEPGALPLVDASAQFEPAASLRSLNAAFLLALAGRLPRAREAAEYLTSAAESGDRRAVATFYRDGLRLVDEEISAVTRRDAVFASRLASLADFLTGHADGVRSAEELTERMWAVFFPEGTGVRGHERERAEELRRRRTIEVTGRSSTLVDDPARQVLFTVNALLTAPPSGREIEGLDLADEVKAGLRAASGEPQLFWYDHPVQMGVEPSGSELLYGLRAMDRGLAFEKRRGTMAADGRLRLVISVSTTHDGLEPVSRRYVEDEVGKIGGLEHVEPYLFTETDAHRLVDQVLVPAAGAFLGRSDTEELLGVVGVRGRYGRHHSFGKAIAALWHVMVDPAVIATFKTDLDHSWPQEELVAETGKSLLQHFAFPPWGGNGVDRRGRALELGAMAGALVNESDIGQSLFTPDVPFPGGPRTPDEFVFFSALTQALSTLGESSTRYGPAGPDGTTTALERVHVHAGTLAIFVDSLLRHRPFTPSFIGRAEDQAYVLSMFGEPEPRLAHVHNRELIQRHDKKGFARAAIEASRISTMIGDYERLLLFSELANALTDDREALKAVADPFTGSFVSRIPTTVAYLRFALKAAAMFAEGDESRGEEFVVSGAERLSQAIAFVEGDPSELKARFLAEREGWDLFYDALDAVEKRLLAEDPIALEFVDRARRLIRGCIIR